MYVRISDKPKNTTVHNSTTDMDCRLRSPRRHSCLVIHASHDAVCEVHHMLLLSPHFLNQLCHHVRLIVREVDPDRPQNLERCRPSRALGRVA